MYSGNLKKLTEYDLYITYSWGTINHGVCGHTFEVVDYYTLLSKHTKCAILLCEDITPKTFRESIEEKYSFSKEEINSIIDNTIFENRPLLVYGTNILFTDGGIDNMSKRVKLLFNNIFTFACGRKDITDNNNKNYHILLDQRVYETKNGTHYVKKIDFENLKKPTRSDNKTLIYATENCRAIDQELVDSINEEMLIVTNNTTFIGDNIEIVNPPVKDLFNRFNKYIYTPIARKWDCSPRFIAECKYFGIDVEYYNIDYLDIDLGLKYRLEDVEHNFESLHLRDDDFIIEFIKNKI